MTLPILVTGGTGTLGRRLVPRLQKAGGDVRVLTRGSRADEYGVQFLTGDLATGEGIELAVDEVATIVHCAGSSKGDEDKTRDRAMFGYFGSKLASERVVAGSGLPWTTLRATQFHDLILMVARALAKLPVIPVPAGSRFQPVDTDEVAARLVELALGEPAGLVPDLAGPHVYSTTDLIRGYLRATHRRRPILPVWLPGRAARAVRAGATLAPEHAIGKRTWEEFLAEQVSQPR
jgi:uncharacterized protein YbjT (DUF2867 family)